MTTIEQRPPLETQLAALATLLSDKSYELPEGDTVREFVQTFALQLSDLHRQCEEEYVRVKGLDDEQVPTLAQGIALARFLRPHFRDDSHPGDRRAYVSRGGAGLPESYLHVYFPSDGYEGGIDRDGRTST